VLQQMLLEAPEGFGQFGKGRAADEHDSRDDRAARRWLRGEVR
jgi:hypothetical protein